MRARASNPYLLGGAVAGAALLALGLAAGVFQPYLNPGLVGAGSIVVVCVAASFAYLAWNTPPAWLITGAILLCPFNSNWAAFGFPGGFAPDRFLLAAGILGLVLRAPPVSVRPRFVMTPLHALFALMVLWAIGSAIAAQTTTDRDSLFFVIDRLVVPFCVFAVAPYAFREARDRLVFLGALVLLGAYVGLTTFFEMVGLHALVFPRFIVDPSVGTTFSRGRGPFLESGVNGMGLFVCAVAAAIGTRAFPQRWARIASAVVVALCAMGILFTLTRAVWLATVISAVLTMLVFRELRRWLLPALVGGALLVGLALVAVPGLQDRVSERESANRSVWERRNVDTAALTMVAERPLVGFGLGAFNEHNSEYFRLLSDAPQVAERRLAIHNVFLLFATDLGLIGLTLFLACLALAVGTVLIARGPPEMRPWRAGLVAITVFWFVEANFTPLGHVFPDMIVWLWAGVVLAGSAPGEHPAAAPSLGDRWHDPLAGVASAAPRRPRALAVIAWFVAVAALAGLAFGILAGHSGSTPTRGPQTEVPRSADYERTVQQALSALDRDAATGLKRLGTAATADEQAQAGRFLAAAYDRAAGSVRHAQAPAGLAARTSTAVAALGETADAYRRLAAAAEAHDARRYAAGRDAVRRAAERLDRALTALGGGGAR